MCNQKFFIRYNAINHNINVWPLINDNTTETKAVTNSELDYSCNLF